MKIIGEQITTNNGKKGKLINIVTPDTPYGVNAYELLVTHKYDSTKRAGKTIGWVALKPYKQVFNQSFIQ